MCVPLCSPPLRVLKPDFLGHSRGAGAIGDVASRRRGVSFQTEMFPSRSMCSLIIAGWIKNRCLNSAENVLAQVSSDTCHSLRGCVSWGSEASIGTQHRWPRQKPPFMQNPSVNRNGTPTTRRALSQVLSSEHPGRRVFQPHPLGHSGAVAGEGLGWGHPLCPTSLLSSVSLFGPFECDQGTQETVEGVRIRILEF